MPRTELPKVDESGPIDYLDEDPEIPTQKYCVVSFISPEKIIKQKQEFMFEKFVAWMDYEWKVKGLENFMAFLSKKYSVKIDDLLKDAQEYVNVRKDEVKQTDIDFGFVIAGQRYEQELEVSNNGQAEALLDVTMPSSQFTLESNGDTVNATFLLRNGTTQK